VDFGLDLPTFLEAVNNLVGAFAQSPNLPKMLNSKSILETVINGCIQGTFVLQVMRPDRTYKTFWRARPDENALKDASLEAILPEHATLSELSNTLLSPGELPQLWTSDRITLRQISEYFSGQNVVQIPNVGYEEPLPIPRVELTSINAAITEAVKQGSLCLINGEASFIAEDIPNGLLTEDAQLQAPPTPLSINDVLPENLPNAWNNGTTSALAITQSLSQKIGQPLPWKIVTDAIEGAYRARCFQLTPDSQPWPCDYNRAKNVKFQLPQLTQPTPVTPISSTTTPTQITPSPIGHPLNEQISVATSISSYQVHVPVLPVVQPSCNILVTAAYLETHQLLELAEKIADIRNIAAGIDLKFKVQIELGGESQPSNEVVFQINQLLNDISDNLELR
jgi:hypothetical protein